MSRGHINTPAILGALRSLLESLPDDPFDASQLRTAELRRLRDTIQQAIENLQRVLVGLDPIKQPPHILDPADPQVVGKLIADTLLIQPRHPLEGIPKFYGSGVYALYYKGDFEVEGIRPYELVSGTDLPIYVGKADPATSGASTPIEQGVRLWGRLQDHRKSIDAARNLNLDDFECRYLVVKSAWQGTAELYLIRRFMPVWNNESGVCYGFGKHGDAADTRRNTRSPWDTLHPGRRWAEGEANVPNPLSAREIATMIAEHISNRVERGEVSPQEPGEMEQQ